MEKSKKKSAVKRVVLVGDSAWNNARIDFEPGCTRQEGHGLIGWALALGIALALLIAGYAVVHRDRDLLSQVWEMSKYLISSIIIGRAIVASRE